MQRPSFLRLLPLAALVWCAGALANDSEEVIRQPAVNIPTDSAPPTLLSTALPEPSPADAPTAPTAAAIPEIPSTAPVADAAKTPAVAAPRVDELKLVAAPAFEAAGGANLRTLDLTARPTDIWVRIRNGFAIPNIDTPLVAQAQAWFLSHDDYLQRAIERSSLYLYHVVEELEKRGMPTELALLPFIESAYNPMAYSPAHASGMWQFIPSTGKDYKLKQNWWQDERRDVVASTDAALNYLQCIYEMHGDWHLALASYNWGEGSVKRAIERNQAAGRPTDYLSLKMPDETRNYVPRLQAVKNILAHPELFGVTLPRIDNQPYFAAVNGTRDIDVTTAARLAGMSLEDFKALNPSFNRPVIPHSANATLLLPADRLEQFQANLENTRQPLATWQAYTLKKGETLNKVAARFGMDLAYLRQVNGMPGNARVRGGATLLVQTHGKALTGSDSVASTAVPVGAMQAPIFDYPPVKLAGRKAARAASRSTNVALGNSRRSVTLTRASAQPASRSALRLAGKPSPRKLAARSAPKNLKVAADSRKYATRKS